MTISYQKIKRQLVLSYLDFTTVKPQCNARQFITDMSTAFTKRVFVALPNEIIRLLVTAVIGALSIAVVMILYEVVFAMETP
jgi:hypothetical protein